MAAQAQIRIGVSGWRYAPWRGNFYPAGLPQKHELAYAARRLNTLEINGTFYSLQRPESFAAWYRATPPGFIFSVKGGRYLTHLKRLNDVRQPLANFFASGLLRLREKLGPILWQFPPFMAFDESRFEEFLALLPRTTLELARLASEHASFLNGRVDYQVDAERPVRHAVEFRHKSFLTERFTNLLRRRQVALVAADVAGKFPTAEDVTTDWVYVRLHGSRLIYASGYTPRELDAWAEKIAAWHAGRDPATARRIGPAQAAMKGKRDVFVYFDNTDVKLRAPVDARALAAKLGVGLKALPRQIRAELKRSARVHATPPGDESEDRG